jgi:putative ABC transport system permease protein
MLRLTIKELAAKKLRLLTTAIAVMLGVAFMAGTLVFTATLNHTFDNILADSYAGTDAYLRGVSAIDTDFGEQTPRLDAGLIDVVANVDGAAAAEGRVSGYAQIIDGNGDPVGDPGTGGGAPTFGESWMTVPELNPYRLDEGRGPAAPGEIVIDRHSADVAGISVGDVVGVLTKSGRGQFTVTGIAKFGTADSVGGASAVLFTSSEAQALVAERGKVDAIAVVAATGVSQDELVARIGRVVNADIEVLTGDAITAESQASVKKNVAIVNTFFMIFAIVALFVGAFIIFNTFSITVAQRQREMALLRAIGASRRQVTRSVLLEASLVGALASAAGIVSGIGIARLLKMLLEFAGIDLPSGDLVIRSSMVTTSLIVGVGVTVASAVFPARRAGKVPPVAAMRAVAIDRTSSSKRRMVAGALVTAAGMATLFAGLADGEGALVGLGALVSFVGVAVLAPMMARPMARLLGWPLARTTRITGGLGRQNAMRNPKRTASTAAALMIGVGLVGFITSFAASAKSSINHAVDTDFRGDYVVESGASIDFGGVSHALAVDLAMRPGVVAVTSSRFIPAEIDGGATTLQSWDTTTIGELFDIEPLAGDIAALGQDGIALEDGYARDHGWQIGSQIPVAFALGETTLVVEAIYGDGTWPGKVFIDHAVVDALGSDILDANAYVKTAGGENALSRSAVEAATAQYPNVSVMDRAEFKKDRAGDINLMLNLIYAMLALAIVIALMGIANTLALSIHERTRELGLLRAVGMTRQQLRATIRVEAVIIALFGTALGLGLGMFFGWAIVRSLAEQGFTEFIVPVGPLAVVATIAVLAGVVAAILPARRAARLDVLDAIAS